MNTRRTKSFSTLSIFHIFEKRNYHKKTPVNLKKIQENNMAFFHISETGYRIAKSDYFVLGNSNIGEGLVTSLHPKKFYWPNTRIPYVPISISLA